MTSICHLIADILPLYADNALSDEGKAVVDEHLASCGYCRKALETLESDKKTSVGESLSLSAKEVQGIRRLSHRIRRTRRAVLVSALALFLALSLSFFSYLKFDTPNVLSAGVGLCRILLTDAQIVEIQKSPRVWLVDAEKSPYRIAKEALAEQGYREITEEQMGSMHVFEKDGEKHYIHFSANRYYAKCSWQK